MTHALLSEINLSDNKIKSSAVSSRDGLVVSYSEQQTLDEDCVSAMSAAIFATSKQGVSKLLGGKICRIIVEGEEGHVLITLPTEDLLLTTVAQAGADIQAILQQMSLFKEKFTNQMLLSEEAVSL